MSVSPEIQCLEALEAIRTVPHESLTLCYLDPPFATGRDFGDFDDRWESLETYVEFIKVHAQAIRPLLNDRGNFILHVDPRTSHYLKVALDQVFGTENFRNEIIWSYASGGASKRHLSKKHDVLLWWSKSDNYHFNVLREPYATPGVLGRQGFHPEGRMITDVWNISFISTTAKERTGYPTQKPLALLKQVVGVWSNGGDVVADFFCGSGTTGVAAALLGRSFLLADRNPRAIEITRERLEGIEEAGAQGH